MVVGGGGGREQGAVVAVQRHLGRASLEKTGGGHRDVKLRLVVGPAGEVLLLSTIEAEAPELGAGLASSHHQPGRLLLPFLPRVARHALATRVTGLGTELGRVRPDGALLARTLQHIQVVFNQTILL